MSSASHIRLRRELGAFGAIMTGLGAMLGTGVFVSLGLGAGVTGPAVLLALALAALIALVNGLSSAQLAAAHPVSGGTYEYGYVYLRPWMGFTAGWVFLIAKSASAATAALGFAGYVLQALGRDSRWTVPLALLGVAALTSVVLAGIKRSNLANIAIVSVTILSLLFFVAAGAPAVEAARLTPFFASGPRPVPAALLEATALMFVAYTGYARIATLGEEVRDPERTIPRAIVVSIVVVMLLYLAVAAVGLGVAGSRGLQAATMEQTAPLAIVAQQFAGEAGGHVLVIGAVTAMLGVLLNLILGLSRVVLAMARRGDLFAIFGRLNESRTTPPWAVIGVGALIGGMTLIGDVLTTWSFSAFAVLIYYALTNLAAWRLPGDARRYPRMIAGLGMLACLGLAFWVERHIWMIGLGLILLGLLWHTIAQSHIRSKGAS